MGCDITYDKNGKMVSCVCTRSELTYDPCAHAGCSWMYDKLCDFPLGGEKVGQTCDKKMCDDHANRFNVDDLPSDIRARVKEHDTFDLCDAHLQLVNKLKGKQS